MFPDAVSREPATGPFRLLGYTHMTTRSRYFLVGSAAVLLFGIGGGLVAYYTLNRAPAIPAGLPAELRFVPADAGLVAYADVHSVMSSAMRRELERLTMGLHRGQQQVHEFAGIDLEKDVNHVVAYIQANDAAHSGSPSEEPPRALILVQGTFDQAKVEQFLQDHGGSVEDYKGQHVIARQMEARERQLGPQKDQGPGPQNQPVPHPIEEALTFVQPDLIATGPIDLVHRALDSSAGAASLSTNTELMRLIRDASSGNAWVVGSFDAVSSRMRLPANVRQQVPPLRLVSVSAHIDGGVKATIKAETADKAAADQLRDVVRGAISFVRLQAGSKPELQETFKSIELGGSGTNVQLSFQLTAEAIRALTPQRPAQEPVQPKP
jgi:hypothetical protein